MVVGCEGVLGSLRVEGLRGFKRRKEKVGWRGEDWDGRGGLDSGNTIAST
jgi:hypothetical protein